MDMYGFIVYGSYFVLFPACLYHILRETVMQYLPLFTHPDSKSGLTGLYCAFPVLYVANAPTPLILQQKESTGIYVDSNFGDIRQSGCARQPVLDHAVL